MDSAREKMAPRLCWKDALCSAKSVEIPLNGGEYTETIKNHLTFVISLVRCHESSQVLECLVPTLKRCTLGLISANLLVH